MPDTVLHALCAFSFRSQPPNKAGGVVSVFQMKEQRLREGMGTCSWS